jgi:hypothetical protein
MACNAWNHPPWCDCGWGGDTGGSGGLSAWTVPPTPTSADGLLWSAGRRQAYESFINPNAHCPVCGVPVYFYQSPYGGRVFFDELGPPWPKHPCTDNGAPPRARLRSVGSPVPSPQWTRDGWHPLVISSDTPSSNGWCRVTVIRVGTVERQPYLVSQHTKRNLGSPLLMKAPSDNGLGHISWLDDDQSGIPSVREASLVNPILEVVPQAVLEAALRGEAVAIAETAILLCTPEKVAAGDDWLTNLPTAQLQLMRHWLEKSAAIGSIFASSWLDRIDEVSAKETRLSPIDAQDDPRLHPDTASYKAFTRLFDEEVNAPDLVDPEEADRLANFFDDLYRQHSPEEVITKSLPDLQGTLVTMLLDNSGSLRGKPIRTLATTVRALADLLTRAGAAVEILGFTTRAWKGGQSHERWLALGKPDAPGRLNDLRHIVYHPSEQPWDGTSWRPLSLMLGEAVLKENIDGEALRWAYLRTLRAPASRRIILVLSDGAPVDDSTLSQNDADYLKSHLKLVAEAIEEQGLVSLVAVGLDHDPSHYYRRSIVITGGISNETLKSIMSLLGML